MVFVVSGGRTEAQELLDAFFHDRGWARRERGEGRIDYECGSRRRTILLGALAGEGFFLTAPVELREREPGTEVRYRWGEGAGAALGGSLGRRRAARAHQQTADALEAHLEHLGLLVQVRRA
ncbi:MAG: hypothetical protein ACTIMA_07215 [Brachybacterium tyrofermentans]|uniref:Uncharacterized protein n=1 Tax=Brachybacterium tyrofermentans TaxID=47848 RepID=A0ABW0FAT0_9MICO|nr:hypothetical protein FM103_00265 [Corynebacterium xerosis]